MNRKSLVVGLLLAIVVVNSLLARYTSLDIKIPESVAEDIAAYVLPEKETREVSVQDTYFVTRVIDGDTIDIKIANETVRVRYIGIDAPEKQREGVAAECFASEATARNRELVEGKWVRLEQDSSETDTYGRLLRHVYLDAEWINQTLISEGFAKVITIPPDTRHTEVFLSLQSKAQKTEQGLWGDVCSSQRLGQVDNFL